MRADAEPIDWRIAVADLGEEGAELSHVLSEAERAALAAHAGIEGVEALDAAAEIRPWADGWEVALRFAADVIQSCVVTLEPVRSHIAETALRRFLPQAELALSEEGELQGDLDEEEPPEPLGEWLDLGAILTEDFILALDPYPRAPGAALEQPAQTAAGGDSPFAALKALKDRH